MKNRRSRSTLFLMELIIAIFFFAITSAVCAQLFAKAHQVSHKTTQLTHAINQAQSIAEAFRSTDGDLESLKELFPEAGADGDTFSIRYDDQGQITSDIQKTAYVATLTILESSETLCRAHLDIIVDGKGSIYFLELIKYKKG